MRYFIGGIYSVDGFIKPLYWNGNILVEEISDAEEFVSKEKAKDAVINNYPKNLGIKQIEKIFIMEVIKNEGN